MSAEETFAFATGGVGAVGLPPLLPPLHAVNDPIATAIANRFISPSKPDWLTFGQPCIS